MIQAAPPNSTNVTESSEGTPFLSYIGQAMADCGQAIYPVAKTAAKVSLSAVYLGIGLSLVGLGAYSSVYSLHKNYQFYFYERPQPPPSYTTWKLMGLNPWYQRPGAPHPDNLGYGSQFKEYCDAFAARGNLASGEAFCNDLANHSWKEINRPESTAAAVAFTIIGGGGTLFLSSYAIIAGISLLGRSFQTFVSAVNDTEQHSQPTSNSN